MTDKQNAPATASPAPSALQSELDGRLAYAESLSEGERRTLFEGIAAGINATKLTAPAFHERMTRTLDQAPAPTTDELQRWATSLATPSTVDGYSDELVRRLVGAEPIGDPMEEAKFQAYLDGLVADLPNTRGVTSRENLFKGLAARLGRLGRRSHRSC